MMFTQSKTAAGLHDRWTQDAYCTAGGFH